MELLNLRIFRKQNGFTQEQVAERIGVSRQAVAKWETGETLPDIESVVKLAELFDVTVDMFLHPLEGLKDEDDSKKHIFGMTKINDNGQVTIPKKARELLGVKPGDTLLVLGDEIKKGLALVKVPEIIGGV